MKVSLTGTPGTGKTTVSEVLEEKDWNVLHLNDLIEREGLKNSDGEVDVEEMVEELGEELEESSRTVVEGHLSHHFDVDYCVVLRCEPSELEERLEKRGYNGEKVRENVESERIDLVLQEAVEEQENVIEIDTTGREISTVAEEIDERIEEERTGYGDIDWLEG